MKNQTAGLRAIIGYKLAKIPVVLGLALWLTLAPRSALHTTARLAKDLADVGPLGSRLALWIQAHVSGHLLVRAAVVAWLDLVTTTIEAVLLIQGKSWGEWLVAGGLGAMVLLEIASVERRPTIVRVVILVLNAAVVAYLVRLRLRKGRGDRPPRA